MNFSPEALKRTIRNRRAGMRVVALLYSGENLRQRAQDSAEILAEAATAVDGQATKRGALVALGKLMRPNLAPGGHEAIARLRTAVMTNDLDREDRTCSLTEARSKLASLREASPGEAERVDRALGLVDLLEGEKVAEVNFASFWNDVPHLCR